MKIAVTGANGFIGRHVVAEALVYGYEVLALVHKQRPSSWRGKPNLTVFRCDLMNTARLDEFLAGCDAVVHLAAVMEGSTQYHDTIKATQNVLSSMDRVGIETLIGVSSLAILDYVEQKPMAVIDEDTDINPNNNQLGCYALMKRDQETIFRNWGVKGGKKIILRPGLIYDDNRLPSAHLGLVAGSLGIGSIHNGNVPVVHVQSVARAVVLALGANVFYEVIHLTDDPLPTQCQYIKALQRKGVIEKIFPLPWRLYTILLTIARIPFELIGKEPDSFRRNSVAARQKPFCFSNKKAREILSWQPFPFLHG